MTGMFVCARAAVRHMVPGVRIVNTASMLGFSGGWYSKVKGSPHDLYKTALNSVLQRFRRRWGQEPSPAHSSSR
jgi:gluconate 5-dehydrogenase/2-deoxy-D-gluconate 3-dehydrogenase